MSFIYNLAATWNNALTHYDGIKIDVNNGAGGPAVYLPGSNLIDLKNNGVSKFSIDPTGIPAFGNSGQPAGYLFYSNGVGFAPTFKGFDANSVDSITRSWLLRGQDTVHVTDFGAKGEGVTNDTTAVTKAFNYCESNFKSLYFPPGTYLVTPPLNVPRLCKVFGASQWNTSIKSTTGTQHVFVVDGPGSTINQLAFISAVPRTANAYIRQNSNAVLLKITDVYTDGAFCAIDINAGATVRMADNNHVNTVAGTGNTIIVGGGSGFVGYRIVCDAPTLQQPFSHVLLGDSAECLLFGCDFIRALNGGYVGPGNGQSVLTFRTTNTLFDTCGVNGLSYSPTGTGVALGHDHSQIWLSNALTAGATHDATGTAVINGVRYSLAKVNNSGSYGFRSTGNKISNVEISDSNVSGCFVGVRFDNVLSGSLKDSVVGPYETNLGNTTGLELLNATDNVQVVDNKLTGNGTAVTYSASGTSNFFRDNIGYQAPWISFTPTLAPAAGASTLALNSAHYQQFEKTIIIKCDVSVTAQNTGAGALNVTNLPATGINNAGNVAGQEIASTQVGLTGLVNTTTASVYLVTGATPIITGYRLVFTITYEAA